MIGASGTARAACVLPWSASTGRRKPPFPLCLLRRLTAGVLGDLIGLWAPLFVDMLEIVIIHRRVSEERHAFLILRLRRPLAPQSSIACLYILRAAVRRLASEGCLSSPAPGRMKGSEVPPVAQNSALCRPVPKPKQHPSTV